ncbi:rho GTPase-activating protein 33-like, partial [Lagopus leucura]|uniref:rho GTPase-activating protein 33-like n=1 Tax=Lagopus leucura TaxID=30410 RepID=UPI001C6738D3
MAFVPWFFPCHLCYIMQAHRPVPSLSSTRSLGAAFARGRTEQSDKKQLRVQGTVYLVLISCQFQLVVPAVMGVACSEISCGPDMTRMEAENNGKPLLVREESSLNIPAIAAAHVIKRYVAQAPGELSLE